MTAATRRRLVRIRNSAGPIITAIGGVALAVAIVLNGWRFV